MRTFTLRDLLAFIRFKVSAAVTFSAVASFMMAGKGISLTDILPLSGIFLLAAGASALNQYQERDSDARMPRTKMRPLPLGVISPVLSLVISLVLILAGLSLIAGGNHLVTAGLGLFNILWYNGLYTYLKRKTAFAVVPGALTGAIPVLMGWTAAGGHLFDPLPLFLAFFIFLWQVPHFWLLALIYEDDYRNAGFPLLSDLFSLPAMKRIIFSWLAAASVTTLMLVFFRLVTGTVIVNVTLLLNAILVIISVWILFLSGSPRFRSLFLMVNLFMVAVFCLLVMEHI